MAQHPSEVQRAVQQVVQHPSEVQRAVQHPLAARAALQMRLLVERLKVDRVAGPEARHPLEALQVAPHPSEGVQEVHQQVVLAVGRQRVGQVAQPRAVLTPGKEHLPGRLAPGPIQAIRLEVHSVVGPLQAGRVMGRRQEARVVILQRQER